MRALDALPTQPGQGEQGKDKPYDALLDALRNALMYTLGK